MIKFFRKIRQGLLTENKFGKYLIYAIGEIVLIAIGILIALSLNNWNENRKVRIKEVTFLDKLTKEINEDIIRLNRNDSIVAIQVSQSKKALKLFHLAKTVKDIIRVDSLFSFQWNNLYINVSTYDEMINTGNFYTLKNKSLQKRIVNYYNSVKGDQIYIQAVNETSDRLRNSPNLNSFNYLIRNYDKNRFDITKIDTSWINDKNSHSYLALYKFYTDAQTQSNIYRRNVFQRNITEGYDLVKAIEQELKKRK